MSLPVEVIEAVAQERCILVLGSRASLEAAQLAGRDYPKSAPLARKLGWKRPRRLMGSKTRPVMPSVEQGADLFQQAHGRPALVRQLRGLVGTDGVAPSEAHRLALKRFPLIITSVWDDLLERCAQQEGLELNLIQRGQPVPDLQAGARHLLKLRGGFENPDQLVVTADDHARRRFAREVQRGVRRVIRQNTVLLVGFRPDEEEFDRLWEDLTDAYGGELPRCHMAVAQGKMDDFMWQKWVWRGLLLFTADPLECLQEVEERVAG